jgi:hypothetical protein
MSNMPVTLVEGDTFWEPLGPFHVEVLVIRVIKAGAEVQYTGRTKLVGYEGKLVAQDGTELTTDPMNGFLGRAHWAALQVTPSGDGGD